MKSVLSGSRMALPAIVAASILFCMPALYNRAAFVFPDTHAYYLGGSTAVSKIMSIVDRSTGSSEQAAQAVHQAKVARSAFYSLFVYILANIGSPWLVVVVQAVILASICYVFISRYNPALSLMQYAALFGFLAVCTPASWLASRLMPDVFAGVLILAMVAAIVFWSQLTVPMRWGMFCAIAGSIVTHASLVVLAAVIGLAALVMEGARARRMPARWLVIAGSGATAVAALLLVAKVGFNQLTLFPGGPPMFLAESIEDGPAKLYLRQHCPQLDVAMCAYVDRLDISAEDFLWSDSGTFSAVSPDVRARIRQEEKAIVINAVMEHPWLAASGFVRRIAAQFTYFGLGDYVFGSYAVVGPADMQVVFPLVDENADWTRWLIVYVVVFLSAVLLARKYKALNPAQKYAIILILLGIAANGVICGGISTPQARYQSRVIWLVPLLAAISLPVRATAGSRTPQPGGPASARIA